MKKTTIVTLVLILALAALCAGCGGSGGDTEAPEATDIPTVTRPPEDGEEVPGLLGADENSGPGSMSREDYLASMSEQQRYVEENLVGKDVQALYDYLGKPKSSSYVTSCMVLDGKDGILQYDGFFVSTTIFSNGVERVMGTGN